MSNVLLSILTPCYNGENFISKYFENLLEQTFKDFEVIIVNDGSSDESDSIINKYKSQFESKGIVFKYLRKVVNEGHARAINDGLKLVTGKYLMWPDIDDYMHPNHLESRIKYMENNPSIDLAIGKSAVFNYNDLSKPVYYAWSKFPKTKRRLIKHFILSENHNIGFMSGTFIVKTSFLWNIYPKKDIYSDIFVGPTIQMVFPAIYLGNIGYISECTFDYYIHGNNQHLVNEKRDYSSIELVYENVIDQLKIRDERATELKQMAKNVTGRLHLSYALKHSDKEMGQKAWNKLKENNGIRLKETIKYLLLNNILLHRIYLKVLHRGNGI